MIHHVTRRWFFHWQRTSHWHPRGDICSGAQRLEPASGGVHSMEPWTNGGLRQCRGEATGVTSAVGVPGPVSE